jgi:hypothetical protein
MLLDLRFGGEAMVHIQEKETWQHKLTSFLAASTATCTCGAIFLRISKPIPLFAPVTTATPLGHDIAKPLANTAAPVNQIVALKGLLTMDPPRTSCEHEEGKSSELLRGELIS